MAEHETIEDIIAEKRALADRLEHEMAKQKECKELMIAHRTAQAIIENSRREADRLEAAHRRELETKDSVIQTLSAARDDELDRHRREVDALKRRRSELDAEVAAKDAVIRKYQEERELRIAAQKAKAAAEGYADGKRDAQVGDAAKLREALAPFPSLCDWLVVNASKLGNSDMVAKLRERGDKARAALAAPPRNCDRFATIDEARKAHEEYRGDYIMRASNKFDFPMKFEAWLFAPATEQKGGNDAD